ncbi:MAG: biotin--[acetyl-CoA-carboxylase] ligase [Selenomonadaceae bacterium]|nr:biotin--[acetyl-CoA-carboxylase] ligase [Selenomonadaceae bacterium]
MKKNILDMLRAAGRNFTSGEAIAEKLNVSRAAVWKHIRALRNNGYEIQSSERLGYRLNSTPDLLLPEIIQHGLSAKIIGGAFVHKDSVDSTNRLAKKLAQNGAADGTVVVAEEQTGGRGRLERNFFSPREKGIWFSLILRPKCLPKDAPKFTLLAAVAVAKAMERFSLRAGIKWPNDILYDGRKLVGILTELSAEVSRVNYIVVGVGINVNIARKEFPAELQKIAASLSEVNGNKNLPRADFFRAVLEEFDTLYAANDFSEIFRLWREFNVTLGKNIRVISAETGDTFNGVALDIDADGALIVDVGGERRTVYAGDVSIRAN